MKIKNLKPDQYFRFNNSICCLIAMDDIKTKAIAKNINSNVDFMIDSTEHDVDVISSKYLVKGMGEIAPFDKPTYTKILGIYGYITITNNKVYFISAVDNEMYCDELKDYTVIKIN